MSRTRAIQLGVAALCVVLVLHVAYCVCAAGTDWVGALVPTFTMFVLPPMVPGMVSLATANPLRTLGSALCLAPWLLLAIYVDCIRPYTGGGASLIYVAVLFWGTPSAIVGALITGPILRWFGIAVVA